MYLPLHDCVVRPFKDLLNSAVGTIVVTWVEDAITWPAQGIPENRLDPIVGKQHPTISIQLPKEVTGIGEKLA
jgi:hypothetical protein